MSADVDFNLLYKRRGTRQPESSRSAALYMRQEEVRSVGAADGVAIEQPTKHCTLLYYPQSINNTRICSQRNAILAILITISNHFRIFSLAPSLLLQHWKDLPYDILMFFVYWLRSYLAKLQIFIVQLGCSVSKDDIDSETWTEKKIF